MSGSTNVLFYPAGIKIGSTYVAQCEDQAVETNIEDLTQFTAGDYVPSFVGSAMQSPVFSVPTLDMDKIFTLCDKDSVARDCTSENVDLWFREAEEAAFRIDETTGAHVQYRLQSNAMLFWDQISVSQGQEARSTLQLHATYNGSNASLVMTPDEAITASPVVNSLYTLGKTVINSSELGGVTSVTWNNNVVVEKIASGGETAPSFVCIKTYRPVITIETHDIETAAQYSLEGEEVTGFDWYLRKRKRASINYADNQTEHIKFAATKGVLKKRRSASSPGSATLEVHLERPAAGQDLFTVTTGVAIP